MSRYKVKKIKDFPDHVKDCCYAITDHGHTMFPSDVIARIKDNDKLVKQNRDHTKQLDTILEKLKESNKILISSLGGLEYSAYNLNSGKKKVSELRGGVIESTCPEDTLLIEIRDLKTLTETNKDLIKHIEGLND